MARHRDVAPFEGTTMTEIQRSFLVNKMASTPEDMQRYEAMSDDELIEVVAEWTFDFVREQ